MPLGRMLLMLRTGRVQDGGDRRGLAMSELELQDWMDERGLVLSDPETKEFFEV